MIILLLITLSFLIFWSLRLMQRGYDQREFSLMFAGSLVAIAGAGLIAAYTLMVGCVGYLGHSSATLLLLLQLLTQKKHGFPLLTEKRV